MKEEIVRCDHCGKVVEGTATTQSILGIERDFCNDCLQEFDKICKRFFPMEGKGKKK